MKPAMQLFAALPALSKELGLKRETLTMGGEKLSQNAAGPSPLCL